MSLPWVEDHPDVFNDAAFTITAIDSMDFTPPTSPYTAVPVVSRDNRDDEQCAAGKLSTMLQSNLVYGHCRDIPNSCIWRSLIVNFCFCGTE